MGVFLDMRSSMHSGFPGSPGVALGPVPELFGSIGLQTLGVAAPIVTLNGTVGVTGEVGDTYVIELVRGPVYDPFNIIYRAQGTVGQDLGPEFITFAAQDLLAPPAMETIYTSYITGTSTSVRTGPEVFSGIAAANA